MFRECHAPYTSFVDFEKEQADCSDYKRLDLQQVKHTFTFNDTVFLNYLGMDKNQLIKVLKRYKIWRNVVNFKMGTTIFFHI